MWKVIHCGIMYSRKNGKYLTVHHGKRLPSPPTPNPKKVRDI